MSRGRSFSCSAESTSLLSYLQINMIVVLLLLPQTSDAIAQNQSYCKPSSCGKISNIMHPFRLKDDPATCGNPRYELSCENNMTVLTLFSGKYYVQEINYLNYIIRLIDSGMEDSDLSSIPQYFLTELNFTLTANDNYSGDPYQPDYSIGYKYIIYLNCSKPVTDDHGYVNTAHCINRDSKSYLYAFAGDYFFVGRLKDYCQVKIIAMSSDFPNNRVTEDGPDRPLSYEQIHGMLLYGFNISWLIGACRDSCPANQHCSLNEATRDFECYGSNSYWYYPLGIEVGKNRGKKNNSSFNFYYMSFHHFYI